MNDKPQIPYVCVNPNGVYWIGHAQNKRHAWEIALGWPDDDDEIWYYHLEIVRLLAHKENSCIIDPIVS